MALINSPPLSAVDTQDNRGRIGAPSEGWRNFFQSVYAICNAVTMSGVTADRPATLLWIGRTYYDTTIARPIWYVGAGVWHNAAGVPV